MQTLLGPNGVVAHQLRQATTARARMRGLMDETLMTDNEALLLRPCKQVHTFGMRFAIDAVFCDADLRVVHVTTLAPRRLSRIVRRARCCIELAAGRAAACGIVPGARLRIDGDPA